LELTPMSLIPTPIYTLPPPNKGLMLNHVSDFSQSTLPSDGLIVYDAIEKCFKGFAGGAWTPCFGGTGAKVPIVEASGPGFQGEFIAGTPLTNNYFYVTITNNSFSPAQISFDKTDL